MKPILSLLFLLALANCFSQKLVSSKLLPCYAMGEVIFKERIASQRMSQDTLFLEVNLSAYCDVDLKATLQSSHDSLFIDLKNVAEVFSICDCCYTMLFTITEVQNPSFTLFINNKKFKFSKSRYADFPPLQIPENLVKNESDASGKKIGYWGIKTKNGNYYLCYYGDGTSPDNEPLWKKCFSKKNQLDYVEVLLDSGETHSFDTIQYERIMKEIAVEEKP